MLARRPKLTVGLLVLAAAGVWTALRAATDELPMAAPLVVAAPFRESSDVLRRNETLSQLFARNGVNGRELLALLAPAPALKPRQVRAGQVFEFRYYGASTVPDRVRARVNPEQQLWLRRSADDMWSAEMERISWYPAPVRITGTVQGSMYQTLWSLIPDSVLSGPERDRLIDDLSETVYGWVLDFSRDVVKGDRFEILFERLTSPLGETRYGRLLAAELETRGRANWAFVLSDDHGNNVYYDEQGRSLRRAFKLSPVPYRITSRYSLSRFHPILQTWRAHLGVDYRAPIGARVSATADGTVIRAGRWGGYGIMVGIRHPNGIETRYAHLSRLATGVYPGARVHQGDVIGYAGMTGLATAPHVHYEFLKNGHQQNPRRIDLGDGTPVPADRISEFQATRTRYDYLLRDPAPHFLALGPN